MKTLEQIRSGAVKTNVHIALVGGPGEGKTYLAATAPKNIFAITCPGEEDTFLNAPELHKNIVGWEHFIPSAEVNAKQTIINFRNFIKDEVRPRVASKECETFTVDNLTFLGEHMWQDICEFRKNQLLTKGGEFDTRSAYGILKDDMRKLVLQEILTLDCNVILNVHLKLEDDETLAKMPDKTVPYNADILGGFRNKLQGMVSYMFYMHKNQVLINGVKDYQYNVVTNKHLGKNAKSRLKLPQVISNVTFNSLMEEINKVRGIK